MAPVFSKIPVLETPGMATLSGLICSFPHCNALFLTLKDAKMHATSVHSSKPAAVTCVIYERVRDDGGVKFYRVVNDEGAQIIRVSENSDLLWLAR
jgi:hypothetical protein